MSFPTSAYIHIPFCKSKCFYCDFASFSGIEEIIPHYIDALKHEISNVAASNSPLETVYFGGGTPTILPASALIDILRLLNDRFGILHDAEITIEANPGTVNIEKLTDLRGGGFNRLSIGVQSFDDRILTRIGRIHTADEALSAFKTAKAAGFDNVSIDLMYALPDQSTDDWKRTLETAFSLKPEHISLYELTVEEGTVFGNQRKQCNLKLPDEDIQIEMYLTAIETLTSAGYEHYEISNFALPGYRSRHNQVYWRNEPYYGFGAGASGYVEGVRYNNISDPSNYMNSVRLTGRAVESSESITGKELMGETVMLGLRMLDGLDLNLFESRFGVDIYDVYPEELNNLISRGLAEIVDRHLRLTRSGLFIANEVMAEFL